MADIGDAIDDLADKPMETEADGFKNKERPLTELIEADKYRKASQGASTKTRGMRFTKLIPPGAV